MRLLLEGFSRTRSLRITDQAEDDLADIWAFIAADNPAAMSGA